MTPNERSTTLDGGPSKEEREARYATSVAELATTGRPTSLLARPHLLLALAGALMTSGLCLIVIGWAGAAHATLVQEQVAYLISGGLLGTALAAIGGAALLAHWLTELARDARDRDRTQQQEARAVEEARRGEHLELMAALDALTSAVGDERGPGNGSTGRARAQRAVRRAPGGA
jgi:hypothetical protein